MTAVDTNIIVRLLTRDHEEQYQKSRKVFREQEVFISRTVLLETEWVLRFAYKFGTEAIGDAFTKMLGLPNVHAEDPSLLHLALEWHKKGLDFADALHLAACQDQSQLMTFDGKFVQKAKGIGRCRVVRP